MRLRRLVFVCVAGWLAGWSAVCGAGEVETLIDQGHWRRARAVLEAQRPLTDPVALAHWAEVLQQFGEMDAALAAAEKAVAAAPASAGARYRLAEVVGEMAERAGTLKQIGLAKRFKKEAEKTLELDPNHVEARFALMVFHLKAPGLVGGDKKQSVRLVAEIERLAPQRAWEARARFAAETKDTAAIGGIYRDAVAKDPGNYDARVARAGWLLAPWRKQAAEAEEHAKAALAIDPGRVAAYSTLAIVYASAKRWEDLEALLVAAEAKIPDDLSPHYQAGRVSLVEAGDAARAERLFRRYLSKPTEAGAVGHAPARWRLAQTLDKLGRRAEAIAELEAAAKLDPKFEPARKELKRLRS